MFRPKRQKPIEVRVEPIVELDYDLLETKLGNKKNDRLWSAALIYFAIAILIRGASFPG